MLADAGGRLGRVTRPLAWRWGPVTTLGTEIEDWNQRVPYEMRQAYASLPWDSNVAAKEIAQQFGHNRTQTFEAVYRHVLKPRRRPSPKVMDTIVSQAG